MEHAIDRNIENLLMKEIFETIFEVSKIDIFEHYEIENKDEDEKRVKYCFKRDIISKGKQYFIDLNYNIIKKKEGNINTYFIVGSKYENSEPPCYYLSNYRKLDLDNIILVIDFEKRKNKKTKVGMDYAIKGNHKKITSEMIEGIENVLEITIRRIKSYLRVFNVIDH